MNENYLKYGKKYSFESNTNGCSCFNQKSIFNKPVYQTGQIYNYHCTNVNTGVSWGDTIDAGDIYDAQNILNKLKTGQPWDCAIAR